MWLYKKMKVYSLMFQKYPFSCFLQIKKIAVSFLLIIALLFSWPLSSFGEETEDPQSAWKIDGKAAVLMDAGSGKVLFEYKAHEKLPIASVTKVMTMLLILEAVDRGQISLEDPVTISEKASSMGGSQMFLETGEVQPLKHLMEGIAMVSANDACVAAAEYHSGSIEIFVEAMNKRAGELGMKNTHFVNTNGLPVANHYSSAYDVGIMSKELLKHIHENETWFTTWMDTMMVGLPGKQTELGLTNTNRLVRTYPGAIGLKTGFTQDAMYCLSGAARKGDLTLVAVILGSPTSQIRFAEATKLLDFGFANYDALKLAEKGEPIDTLIIEKASPRVINAVAPQDVAVLIRKGDKNGIRGESVFNSIPQLPITRGQQIGELVIYQNDREIDRYPLVAEEDVHKAGYLELYIRMLKEGVK